MQNYDIIVPVPLDPRRRFVREFNQAMLIARLLTRHEPRPRPKIFNCLVKKRKTAPQSQLKREERLENLTESFQMRKKRALDGAHILLVDDIFTTGSTLNECAKVLKKSGAGRVDFFTVARGQLR